MPRFDPEKPSKRLIVDELDSVGLVVAGANGASDIMITKKKDPPKRKPLGQRIFAALRGGNVEDLEKELDKAEVEVNDAVTYAIDFAAGAEDLEKARNVAQWFEAQIHSDFTMRADGMFGDGYLTRDERISLSAAIGAALSAFAGKVEADAPELLERDPYMMPESGNDVTLSNTTTGHHVTIPVSSSTGSGANAPTIQLRVTPTIDKQADKSDEKEAAEMPDITLSDEARADLDDTVKEYVEQLEAQLAESTAEPTPDPEPVDLMKDADPAIQALFKEQEERLAKAEQEAAEAAEVAKTERDARIAKEYLEKSAGLSHIAKAEELAPIYRKAMTGVALSADEAALLEGWLKAANQKLETSEFYSELGRRGPAAEGSAEAALTAKADEIRKASPELSKEQAMVRAMGAHPDLAQRMDAEERDRVARSREV